MASDGENRAKLDAEFDKVDAEIRLDSETAAEAKKLLHVVVDLEVRGLKSLFDDTFFVRRCIATAIFIASAELEQRSARANDTIVFHNRIKLEKLLFLNKDAWLIDDFIEYVKAILRKLGTERSARLEPRLNKMLAEFETLKALHNKFESTWARATKTLVVKAATKEEWRESIWLLFLLTRRAVGSKLATNDVFLAFVVQVLCIDWILSTNKEVKGTVWGPLGKTHLTDLTGVPRMMKLLDQLEFPIEPTLMQQILHHAESFFKETQRRLLSHPGLPQIPPEPSFTDPGLLRETKHLVRLYELDCLDSICKIDGRIFVDKDHRNIQLATPMTPSKKRNRGGAHPSSAMENGDPETKIWAPRPTRRFYYSPQSQKLGGLDTPEPSPEKNRKRASASPGGGADGGGAGRGSDDGGEASAKSPAPKTPPSRGRGLNATSDNSKIKHILAMKRVNRTPDMSGDRRQGNVLGLDSPHVPRIVSNGGSSPFEFGANSWNSGHTPISAAHLITTWVTKIMNSWPQTLPAADGRALAHHVPGIAEINAQVISGATEKLTALYSAQASPNLFGSHQHAAGASAAGTAAPKTADVRFRDTLRLASRIYIRILWNAYSAETRRLHLDGVDDSLPPSPRAGEPWQPGSPSKTVTRALLHVRAVFASTQYHTALMAVACEIALKARSYIDMTFPKILEIFEVTAFDFVSVLDTAKRGCTSLPEPLEQHLFSIEYQILESTAWQPDQAPATLYLCHKSAESSDSDSANVPRKVSVFLKKLRRLAAMRIASICRLFDGAVDESARDCIWTVVERIFTEEMTLMKNRHLDSLVLCAIYAVGRLRRLKTITFKHIIQKYQILYPRRSRRTLHVVACVATDDGKTANIIQFYNTKFVPRMKAFVCALGKSNSEGKTDSAAASSAKDASTVTAEIHKLPEPQNSMQQIKSYNLFVSNRRSHMTPQTRALYAFGEVGGTHSRRLNVINETLNNSSMKRQLALERQEAKGPSLVAARDATKRFNEGLRRDFRSVVERRDMSRPAPPRLVPAPVTSGNDHSPLTKRTRREAGGTT